MNNLTVYVKTMSLTMLVLAVTACTIEPVQPDKPVEIRGAPDWVNKGSVMLAVKDRRIFRGVSSSTPQGDMALQKSIADDKSIEEVARVLSGFLENVSNDYMESGRSRERGNNEDAVYRVIEDASTRQVNEGVMRQIDESVTRQYKEGVTPQFKEAVSRRIVASLSRQIKEAVSTQVDLAYQIEDAVTRNFKEDVTRQIRDTAKRHVAGAKYVNSWRDPKTNTFWSYSEMEMRSVKKSMSGASDINVDLRRFFESEADNIFDRATKEKESMFPFFQMK